jgi:hypothetical protein
VYGREYGGKELSFEASGGLLYYSLIMRDKETDSYWSLMSEEALAGQFQGTRLEELPVSTKTQWKSWVAEHPDTLVLSVDGVEHEEVNRYETYLSSEQGPRGSTATDDRLPTKAPIYAFRIEGRPYAVPFSAYEGGATFQLGEESIFLYRPRNAAIMQSTVAFRSAKPGFQQRDGAWHHLASGARFDPETAMFEGPEPSPGPLDGFDTFWFHWSMNHPDSELITGSD